ncbi:MAG: helix-turn-helix domain-containing protein [Flavobacteriaceae bacterium]
MSYAAVLDLRPMRAQRDMSDCCEIQSLRAEQHDVVFYEGDAAGRYFKLVEGAMMLYRLLPDGRRQIVALLSPGDYFGLTSAAEYDCTAEVLRPSRVAAYDRDACSGAGGFQQVLAGHLVEKLSAMHAHMVLLGRKSAMERLATFLAELAGRVEEGQARIRLSMTRQEIADYLGLTIETVSRSFSDLRRRGVIAMERQDLILIGDMSAITALTGDE